MSCPIVCRTYFLAVQSLLEKNVDHPGGLWDSHSGAAAGMLCAGHLGSTGVRPADQIGVSQTRAGPNRDLGTFRV